jgi:hypothetical protein
MCTNELRLESMKQLNKIVLATFLAAVCLTMAVSIAVATEGPPTTIATPEGVEPCQRPREESSSTIYGPAIPAPHILGDTCYGFAYTAKVGEIYHFSDNLHDWTFSHQFDYQRFATQFDTTGRPITKRRRFIVDPAKFNQGTIQLLKPGTLLITRTTFSGKGPTRTAQMLIIITP